MTSTVRAAPHLEVNHGLQAPVPDCLRQISIMHHLPPRRQRLVRGDQDRLSAQVPVFYKRYSTLKASWVDTSNPATTAEGRRLGSRRVPLGVSGVGWSVVRQHRGSHVITGAWCKPRRCRRAACPSPPRGGWRSGSWTPARSGA